MALLWRLLRALWLVFCVFFSYALQLGLQQALRRRSAQDQRSSHPVWLVQRRERVHARNAARLFAGILELRGAFVKLGQVLSVMIGILPPVYRRTLEALQDQVPPRPFSDMEPAFVRSFGKPASACFRDLDPQPIAAASLGQVHLAHLADGTEVAVKILYPDIRAVIAIDMRVLRLAMRLFRLLVPLRNLEVVHEALVDLLARETDYVHEAASLRKLRANFAGDVELLFPEVIDALSSREVLTMTRMHGIKVSDVAALQAAGIDPGAVGRKLLSSFFRQLLVHRYFHADPHPGNFLVQAGPSPQAPRIVVLDFGAVCEARGELVDGLIEALIAFFSRDGARVLGALEQMGFVAQDGDRALLERTVLLYFERLLRVRRHSPRALLERKPGELRKLLDPELELFALRDLARALRVPPGWFYIERAAVMMFGLCGAVAPDLDILQVAFPYVMPLLQARTLRHQPPGQA
jgi:predicted unusual protein kinase regulating ubiquinone biosynthesis (AarF/ABC1/UbiB family)